MLPKNNRLSLTTFDQKLSFVSRSTPLFNLRLYTSTPTSPIRFTFVVSKKVDSLAANRNLLKRRFSSTIQTLLPNLKSGHDLIIFPKSAALAAPQSDLQTSLTTTLSELNLINS